MYNLMKMPMASLKTDKTSLGFGLFPRSLGIQHERHTTHRHGNFLQLETGQVKFQYNLGTIFIHVGKWSIFTLITGIVQFKCMQQSTHFTDMTIENFLTKRLFA